LNPTQINEQNVSIRTLDFSNL